MSQGVSSTSFIVEGAMAWTKLWFGKHKGKTLPRVLFSDPDYFFWAIDKGIFHEKGLLTREARELDRKARRIRIPQAEGEDLVAEYFLDPVYEKIAGVEVVPRSRRHHSGGSPTYRLDCFDLSVPRGHADYDKGGYAVLLKDIKTYLFGDPGYRMTKPRCEEFFSNDENFVD